jgi:hypothetical protein
MPQAMSLPPAEMAVMAAQVVQVVLPVPGYLAEQWQPAQSVVQAAQVVQFMPAVLWVIIILAQALSSGQMLPVIWLWLQARAAQAVQAAQVEIVQALLILPAAQAAQAAQAGQAVQFMQEDSLVTMRWVHLLLVMQKQLQ